MQTTEDLLAGDVRGKRVLVRSDLNVPLDADKNITDDGRLRASVPTITALTGAGAAVIVVAHLGRPKGAPEDKYSLQPVVDRFSELLGTRVQFASDTVGESAKSVVELPCPYAGRIVSLHANAGDTVSAGQPLLSVAEASAEASAEAGAEASVEASISFALKR